MPRACALLFSRFCFQSSAALFVLILTIFNAASAHAQAPTLIGTTNILAWAKPTEVAMEGEGTVRLTVVRASGLRGKLSVDVLVTSVSNSVVPATFKGTNLVFNDYQLSASFNVPISDNTTSNANGMSPVLLQLTNAVLVAGQDLSLTPVLSTAKSKMELDVFDNDVRTFISFEKVNYQAQEGETIQFVIKLGSVPSDPNDLAAVSVDYAIQAPTAVQLAPGADAATLGNDVASASGTLTFDSTGKATLDVPIMTDQDLEFDEEFIVQLSSPKGDFPDPASTNDPPARLSFALAKQTFARGRILFNTNFLTQPMPAGSVDQRFNADNADPLRLRHPGANGPVTSLAIDYVNTNYYVAGNFTAVDAITRHGLARLNSTGAVDQAFSPALNVNGPVTSVSFYGNGPLRGDVVIGGGFTAIAGEARNSVARYLPSGALDMNFSIGLGANGPIYAVKAEGDNSTLVAGDFTLFDGEPRNRIARLLPDGSLDPDSFNGTGANGPIFDLGVRIPPPFRFSDSQQNVTNEVSHFEIVASRVGVLELTYNNLGFTNHWEVFFGNDKPFDRPLSNPFTLITNADSTITTNYTPQTVIIDLPRQPQRVNSLVVRVSPIPVAETNAVSWDYSALVTPLGTDNVIAVGDFTQFNNVPVNRVIETDEAGVVDDTFASNIGTGASGPVLAVDLQSDDSYVLGGAFNSFNSISAGNIARLSPDGVLDEDFAAGTGANGAIRDIFIEKKDRTSDTNRIDKIYIGGDFTQFNGSRRIFLARLFPDGFLDTSFMDSAFNQFAGFPSESGFAPDGSIAAITVGRNPDPVVGGIFDVVGGGTNRTSVKPRQNVARLIGGETPGPGNFTFISKIFGGDEDGESLTVNQNTMLAATNVPVADGLVLIRTADQSAIGGVDYQPTIFKSIPLVPTTTNWFFQVPIIDDNIIEGDEDFLITMPEIVGFKSLGGEPIYPEFAYGPIAIATGRIVENDVPPAVFSFSQPEYNVDENRGNATIEIFRTGNTGDRVTVEFSAFTAGGANGAGPFDFTPVTNQIVTFASGVTNVTVTVPIRDDLIVEADETVSLVIGGPSSGGILDPAASTAVLNIVDNDLPSGKIDFSFAGFTVVEGELKAVVTAVRSGGNVGFITVDYQTVDGTAKAGFDYVSTTGKLMWNDRDIATRTILITIVDDSIVEAPETFTVQLINPSQPGIIGTRHPTATVTINDNDFFGDLSFSAPQYYADENGASAIIQVVRRNGSAETVSVTASTSPGSNAPTAAVPGIDYNDVTTTLNFGPGETAKTFTIPILDDLDPDGTREVKITLSAPVNGTLGAQSVATLSIVDNETVNIPAGGVDTDFVPGGGANGLVNVVAIHTEAPARKILVAGDFTLFDFISRERIARLNNDGSLDRNFAVNTKINGAIRAMIVLPDTNVMIAGHFTQVDGSTVKYVARLNIVGHLDSSFQPGAGADNAVYALAHTYVGEGTNKQSRVLIGGDFVNFNSQQRTRVARLLPSGALDLNFNPGVGPNSSVYAIAVQRDQKVIIGGDFDFVAGVPRAHIARLNEDGSLDTTFDPGDGFDGSVRSIVIDADDRILVGGNFLNFDGASRPRIARLLEDGSNDTSFNPGSGANAIVNSIALQTDGKIVLGGDFGTFNGAQRRGVVRLLENGSIDLSINFGSGPNGVVNSLALQSDREIVIGGDFTEVDGEPRNKVARLYGGSAAGTGALEFAEPVYSTLEGAPTVTLQVRRTGGLEGTVTATYQTSGITATAGEDYTETTDTVTFGPGEVFRTITIPLVDDFIPEPDEIFAVTLRDPVGGIIGRQPVATVQIISDDTRISFVTDEFVVNENIPGNRANITIIREGVSTQPVTVLFSVTDDTATDGEDYTAVSVPITFDPGDTTKIVSVPLLDDTIVEDTEKADLHLALVNPAPDIGLGRSSAKLTIVDNDAAPGTLEFAGPAVVDENAKTVSLTVTRTGGKLGTVGISYATVDVTAKSPADYKAATGTVTFQQTDTAKTIVIQIEDDKEVEGNESFLVRLSNPTGGATLGFASTASVLIVDDDFGPGSLDETFKTGTGADGTIYAVRIQPDGKILAGGDFADFNNSGHPKLVRLLPDGDVDDNFSSSSGPAGPIYAIDLSDQGRIVVGGDFRSFNSIDRAYYARLTPTGSVDPSTAISPVNNFVRTLISQPDYKVVIGGGFTSPANRAGRVLVNGAFDVSFNVGAGANADVLDAQLQADGKVIYGGAFTQFGGLPRGHVVRLFPNGLVDPGFDTSVGTDGDVNRVLPMPDGRTLVAGNFTHFNGATAPRIVMLTTNGVVDSSFSVGTGPDDAVFALALQADGKILIAGDFANVNGEARQRIARLTANGSLDDTFKPGLGPDGRVYDIDIQADTQIVIAGAFNSVNGFPRRGIARLNSTEPPPPPVQISTVSIAGTDLLISFESTAGVTYEIEATSDLGNKLSWITVKSVPGTGSIIQTAIPIDAGYEFFRVKSVAP